MFDNPGKKLRQLEEELQSLEPETDMAAEFAETEYENLEDEDAVLAPGPNHSGLKTLAVVGLFVLGCYAAARWWLGWI